MTTRTPVHSPRYVEVLEWGAQLHVGQYRKGKQVPTISHLIAVNDLLHDAIEDPGVSAEQIAKRFGERASRIVVDCTHRAGPTAPGERKEPWLVCSGAIWSICRRWSGTRCR